MRISLSLRDGRARAGRVASGARASARYSRRAAAAVDLTRGRGRQLVVELLALLEQGRRELAEPRRERGLLDRVVQRGQQLHRLALERRHALDRREVDVRFARVRLLRELAAQCACWALHQGRGRLNRAARARRVSRRLGPLALRVGQHALRRVVSIPAAAELKPLLVRHDEVVRIPGRLVEDRDRFRVLLTFVERAPRRAGGGAHRGTSARRRGQRGLQSLQLLLVKPCRSPPRLQSAAQETCVRPSRQRSCCARHCLHEPVCAAVSAAAARPVLAPPRAGGESVAKGSVQALVRERVRESAS